MVIPDFDENIAEAANLFNLGLDSVATMMLISELEEQFAIDLSAVPLEYENFSSIRGISAFVLSLSQKTHP